MLTQKTQDYHSLALHFPELPLTFQLLRSSFCILGFQTRKPVVFHQIFSHCRWFFTVVYSSLHRHKMPLFQRPHLHMTLAGIRKKASLYLSILWHMLTLKSITSKTNSILCLSQWVIWPWGGGWIHRIN